MKTHRFTKIEELAYQLAAALEEQAVAACANADTSAVHYYVTEARKVGNLPRQLKMRFGESSQ